MMLAMKYLFLHGIAGVSVALDNGFMHPPMGWSALYGAPFGQVDETNVVGAAKGLAAGGLSKFGYEYITLDDWYADRDANGTMIANPQTFPSGMPAVSNTIHGLGLKFGIYSAASQRTCGNYSASEFNEVKDADTFANSWKIDYLKYDACLYNAAVQSRPRYTAMSRALNATGRKIFYSVEGWTPDQGNWGPEVANMWRTGNDIWPKWDLCILHNLYETNVAAPYQRPGAFNDPDMIQPPGTIPGRTASPGLTMAEATSQFVLWAIMKAPLILGVHWSVLGNLSTVDPAYFDLITNEEIIAIDQDMSLQATLVCQMPSHAQQTSAKLNVTIQQCNPTRCDQKFVAGAGGTVMSADGSLCITTDTTTGEVTAEPCDSSNPNQHISLQKNSQFTIAKLSAPDQCLLAGMGATFPTAMTCPYKGTLPPPLDANNVAGQIFLWDAQEGQIITGGGGECLTMGNPNLYVVPRGEEYTNNGTLEHEVWTGPLSSGKQVVVLFNKGTSAETITASPTVLSLNSQQPLPVRDILAKVDLAPLVPGAGLSAIVDSHSVKLFVLG
eukprot:m.65370 g.65370  ORF g.65370 m.65370 type:complete len:555 (+) comp23553_c0_seq1:167-1831(+)